MRLSRVVLRILAFLMLTALLVGVPVAVFKLVGVPLPGAEELRDAWQHRQIGGELVVRVGAAIFAVLWLWFSVTALTELGHVISWRVGGPAARLRPLPPGPSGAVRALVRFIVVSSVTATATFGSFVPLARATITTAARPISVMTSPTGSLPATSSVATVPTHLAVGRETPFSLAAMLGRAELRESIIELNLGRVGPDGMAWQGGVFPAGMEVVLPEELVVDTPLGPAHEVVSGDSYWAIADEHLGHELERDATEPEVMAYTESLMSTNHQLLGHRDPALILPGELVVFTTVGDAPHAPVPVVEVDPVVEVPVDVHRPEFAAPDVIIRLPATIDAPAAPPQEAVQPNVVEPNAGSTQLPSLARPTPESGGVLPYAAGLGAALMMSAGVVGLLESRRRRELRSATVGARRMPPSAVNARTEVLLRSLNPQERLARLDLALRSAAPSLAAQSASVHAAVMYDTGDVSLFLRGAATPATADWKFDVHANTWRLAGAVTLTDLAEQARLCAQPCPAMVHVGGVAEGGELFVDVEAIGTLLVQSPHASAVLRSMAASLAVSPFIEATRIFTVGLGDVALGSQNSEAVDSLDAALDAASMSLGSTAALARANSTFGLRVAGAGGEAWEPSVVVALVDEAVDPLDGVVRSASCGGRGLAVVVGSEESTSASVADAGEVWTLRCDGGQHVLEPLGVVVQPVGVSAADVALLTELLESCEVIAPDLDVADLPDLSFDAVLAEPAVFVAPDHALMVRVLGPVHVASCDGVPADCERSKATELIVWLSQHRERPTRAAARTALWDLDVRDATFANVVSDARRAMARATPPAEGEEWIARTLTEDLPLHTGVVTDAELLSLRVAHARGLSSLDAIDVLRPGVELLAGLPFAGTSYLWTDAEGITSSLILLATGAAIELANHYLLLGDVDGVFWATGQGLKVLSGHEELISLRMRAHARRGDLSGVRGEWESYERAIAADPWAAAEPAPKLVALRRELLAPTQSQHDN
ncbi:MAG TPA: hypothetical protein PLP26_12870 [Ilumatobacteraceae bacterium]|nr:hypothetical protein [Ilumatobacteraceae bacterium]